MASLMFHCMVSILIGLIFGVLIDFDHFTNIKSFRVLFESFKSPGKVFYLERGIFHDLRVWGFFVCAMVAWTIHLIMDRLIY